MVGIGEPAVPASSVATRGGEAVMVSMGGETSGAPAVERDGDALSP
jgi:hypothetical protein